MYSGLNTSRRLIIQSILTIQDPLCNEDIVIICQSANILVEEIASFAEVVGVVE